MTEKHKQKKDRRQAKDRKIKDRRRKEDRQNTGMARAVQDISIN